MSGHLSIRYRSRSDESLAVVRIFTNAPPFKLRQITTSLSEPPPDQERSTKIAPFRLPPERVPSESPSGVVTSLESAESASKLGAVGAYLVAVAVAGAALVSVNSVVLAMTLPTWVQLPELAETIDEEANFITGVILPGNVYLRG